MGTACAQREAGWLPDGRFPTRHPDDAPNDEARPGWCEYSGADEAYDCKREGDNNDPASSSPTETHNTRCAPRITVSRAAAIEVTAAEDQWTFALL